MRLASTLALFSVALAACLPAAAGSAHASLRLVSAKPLTLAGKGFRAGERVQVRVRGAANVQKRTTTSAAGSFKVAFAGVAAPEKCGDGITATAVGASGDSASVKQMLPDCPPSLG